MKTRLGESTRISRKVNDIEGFWISFKIGEEDEYWLVLPQRRLERPANWQWLWWAVAGFGLSLMGAGFISGLINRPLARLAIAARTFASGKAPEILPESGSAEERDANHSFNQMVSELENNERERTEILAGISHDLRTPLTRIQLELEMSLLSEEEKKGMQTDIHQMDAIVGQFLDYARLSSSGSNEIVNMSALLEKTATDASRSPDVLVQSSVKEGIFVRGNHTDFERMFNNLVSNAQLYGRSENTGLLLLDISCREDGDDALIEISDQGVGISEEDRERLLRPFTRLNTARSQASGSGLGLAIVNRIVQRHGGRLLLKNNEENGLIVSLRFPQAGKNKP
jgi:two-component system osmolarity sensor histidine kinase EnvZ